MSMRLPPSARRQTVAFLAVVLVLGVLVLSLSIVGRVRSPSSSDESARAPSPFGPLHGAAPIAASIVQIGRVQERAVHVVRFENGEQSEQLPPGIDVVFIEHGKVIHPSARLSTALHANSTSIEDAIVYGYKYQTPSAADERVNRWTGQFFASTRALSDPTVQRVSRERGVTFASLDAVSITPGSRMLFIVVDDGIRLDLTPVTRCGDGVIDSGEACDDANTRNGDGCSNACAVEDAYSCSGTPSVCAPSCGAPLPAPISGPIGGDAMQSGFTPRQTPFDSFNRREIFDPNGGPERANDILLAASINQGIPDATRCNVADATVIGVVSDDSMTGTMSEVVVDTMACTRLVVGGGNTPRTWAIRTEPGSAVADVSVVTDALTPLDVRGTGASTRIAPRCSGRCARQIDVLLQTVQTALAPPPSVTIVSYSNTARRRSNSPMQEAVNGLVLTTNPADLERPELHSKANPLWLVRFAQSWMVHTAASLMGEPRAEQWLGGILYDDLCDSVTGRCTADPRNLRPELIHRETVLGYRDTSGVKRYLALPQDTPPILASSVVGDAQTGDITMAFRSGSTHPSGMLARLDSRTGAFHAVDTAGEIPLLARIGAELYGTDGTQLIVFDATSLAEIRRQPWQTTLPLMRGPRVEGSAAWIGQAREPGVWMRPAPDGRHLLLLTGNDDPYTAPRPLLVVSIDIQTLFPIHTQQLSPTTPSMATIEGFDPVRQRAFIQTQNGIDAPVTTVISLENPENLSIVGQLTRGTVFPNRGVVSAERYGSSPRLYDLLDVATGRTASAEHPCLLPPQTPTP